MGILLVIVGAAFLWALIYKPDIIAILLFTLVIADINLELKGLPLNVRALVSLALMGRIMVEPRIPNYPSFLLEPHAKYIIAFLIYCLIITAAWDMFDFSLFKEMITTGISAYCGYYYFTKHNNYQYLKTALLISGVICFADLAYTYAVVGSFPIRRIYEIYFPNNNPDAVAINHNFYGLVCGIAFIFLLNEFIYNRAKNKLSLFLLPVMFLGVVMSTSRTTLLVILLVFAILIIASFRSRENTRRIYKLIAIIAGCFFLSLFLFQAVHSLFNIDSDFLEKITTRLIDEPIAVINKHLGYNYNVANLDSMEWREEASSMASTIFWDLKWYEQLFGIGIGGFIERNYGDGLNAHNGILLLMIETGIVGFFLYFGLVISLIRRAGKHNIFSPALTALIFIILFTIGNNNEMTSATAFLIIGTCLAEIKYSSFEEREVVVHDAFSTASEV